MPLAFKYVSNLRSRTTLCATVQRHLGVGGTSLSSYFLWLFTVFIREAFSEAMWKTTSSKPNRSFSFRCPKRSMKCGAFFGKQRLQQDGHIGSTEPHCNRRNDQGIKKTSDCPEKTKSNSVMPIFTDPWKPILTMFILTSIGNPTVEIRRS